MGEPFGKGGAGGGAQAVVAWVEWGMGEGEGESGGGGGGGWRNEPSPQRAAVVYLDKEQGAGVRARVEWDAGRGGLTLRAERC